VGGGGGSFVKIKEYGTRWVGERGGELLSKSKNMLIELLRFVT
jgi:hypothetical protein